MVRESKQPNCRISTPHAHGRSVNFSYGQHGGLTHPHIEAKNKKTTNEAQRVQKNKNKAKYNHNNVAQLHSQRNRS